MKFLLTVILALGLIDSSQASTMYDFSGHDSSGNAYNLSITIESSPPVPSPFPTGAIITGVSGAVGNLTVTDVALQGAMGSNDNLLYVDNTFNWYFRGGGLSLVLSDGSGINIHDEAVRNFYFANGSWIFDNSFKSLHYQSLNFNSVSDVPEPEHYAMFLAGLGIVGLVASRKKV